MDVKQQKELREPFPASAIGKLPKPYKADSVKGTCRECGGYHGLPAVHLDYVGHAATTDRLLKVDPAWSWEPFSTDDRGLPALDNKGNLWIRLTVCGVTRIGVGDGKNAKEVIGDAIRNAAMRFGVALDLWAKEDLHEIAAERGDAAVTEAPANEPTAEAPAPKRMSRAKPAEGEPVDNSITPAQVKKIGATMTALGMTDRTAALEYVSQTIGRQVESRNDLTRSEAHRLIEALEKGGQ